MTDFDPKALSEAEVADIKEKATAIAKMEFLKRADNLEEFNELIHEEFVDEEDRATLHYMMESYNVFADFTEYLAQKNQNKSSVVEASIPLVDPSGNPVKSNNKEKPSNDNP